LVGAKELVLCSPGHLVTVPCTGSSAILLAVEQRIGPYIQPVLAAGTDPAYVPGITAPRPAETEETAPEKAAEQPPEEAVREDTVPEDTVTEDAPEEPAGSEEDDEETDGPVFEVSDRRGSIIADRTGIRFRLDEEEADFHWDEIGAVEFDTPRFGRRFTVTVYMTTRRWYKAEVEAPARSRLKEWTAELDVALDAYFEPGEQ
jgi:hypothetical protein